MAFQTPTGEWSTINWETLFMDLTATDGSLKIALTNTFIHFVTDFLFVPFHLFIAYLLYKKIKGFRAFQVILYLPAIINGVVMTTAFKNFVNPSGPVGQVLISAFGMSEAPEFFNNSDYATWSILFYKIWVGWGGNMMLFGGALARIPLEILESARLDGVGSFKELVRIIFPLLWPTVSTMLILMMTGIFTASGPILLFTRGSYNTSTLAYWIFDKVKYVGESAYNQVAATGLFFTLLGLPVVLFARWLAEKVPSVEY